MTDLSLNDDDVLDLVAWNVLIENEFGPVRDELKDMIEKRNPEVIVLMEASRMFGHLGGLGYKVVHMRNKPHVPGNTPGQANIAIMVRKDIKIKSRLTLALTLPWIGPKIGRRQDPRVYRAVRIKFNGKVWKIGGAHTPFGEAARRESRFVLTRFLKKVIPGRPTILVLDANMSMEDFKKDIAIPGGADAVDGKRIDLIAVKNATLLVAASIGRRISDHPAMLYRVRG